MSDNFQLLQEAVDRNTPVTVSLVSAGIMQPFRSRLLAVTEAGIMLQLTTEQRAVIDGVIKTAEAVRVSFRNQFRNVQFDTTISDRFSAYQLNAATRVEAARLRPPTEVRAVQRRTDYRASVPSNETVKFDCWRVSETDDLTTIPAEAMRIVVDVRDVSSGGLGGTWKRRKNDPSSLADGQRFRVDITSPIGQHTFEGRLRFLEPLHDPAFVRIGIQYLINRASIVDRQKMIFLSKLMGELQREELRRKKVAR